MAMSNYHLGKFDDAIKLLETLAADNNSPFMEEAMFYLAESYANSGQKVPAFNMYNNIIKNNNYNNQKARENIKNLR
jgi:TolA-binding protein